MRFTFEHKKEIIDDDIEMTEEQKSAAEPKFEVSKMEIEIKKIKDQAKHCIEFTRKAGSASLFYE